MNKEIFKIEKNLNERLKKKWSSFKIDVEGFDFGSKKVQIQTRIAKEFLKSDIEQMKTAFKGLCIAFTDVCYEYKIPCNPLDIVVAVEDELLDRGVSVKVLDEVSGKPSGLILMSRNDFKVSAFWMYTFLHELSHSWVSGGFSSHNEQYSYSELSIDLVAICALRKIMPPHKRLYREVIKYRTYFGRQESKELLGKDFHKQILENPEASLKEMGGDLQRQILKKP